MRRLLSSLLLFAGLARVAEAHTLASDDGLPVQLLHQMLGWHHVPITVLSVLVGLLMFRVW